MSNYELLAPAGDFECLEVAINFGADAVYLGGPGMQLRASKAGFDTESLQRAVSFVHGRGKKIYITVNSFAKSSEIDFIKEYAKFLYNIGADAVIVSDLGAICTIHHAAPDLEIHVSTQANCMNYQSALAYYKLGARRIVLARELSLNEIRQLRDNIPDDLELEAFVHGAMCMSYSGRCLISSYLTERSGNRGECSQPCRWKYYLMEEKRPGEYFPVEEDGGTSTILSSHDMCCINFLDEIKAAGVTSFKIEGRMKSAYYVATAVNAYRCALDGSLPISDCAKELECIKHRPYSSGFYYGKLINEHYNDGRYEYTCTFVGTVISSGNGCVTVQQRNNFKLGEILEVLSPGIPVKSFTVTSIKSESGVSQDSAPHPMQNVVLECPFNLKPGDILRRRS